MNTIREIFDALDVMLGVWLAISATLLFGAQYFVDTPYLFPPDMALWVTFGLGIAAFVSGMWGETLPRNSAPEIIDLLIGLVVFLSPWIFGFADARLASWNSWLVGAALMVSAVVAMPPFDGEAHTHIPRKS